MIIAEVKENEPDRCAQFAAYAKRCAEGEVVIPPLWLKGEERRLHIRRTLREDHQQRIHNRPEGAQEKFDKLAKSAFTFFRGTALLWYRDYAGTDAHLPTVFVVGDVHPENFGVSANEDGAPYFGVNDFDEAYSAPFSWDVKRGATGFNLVARDKGYDKPTRKTVVKSFVDGYLRGLVEFARNDRERWHEYRIDNSPPMIRDLLESVQKSRPEFLGSMIDLDKGRFIAADEIVPHSKHKPEFQQMVDQYCKELHLGEEARGAHFKVKDVAIKVGSGTASLGLERYFVLIDGESSDPADDVLLEVKQSRRSALAGLVPPSPDQQPQNASGEAERVVYAHRIHVAGGDRYYGEVSMNGHSYLVRERSPFKAKIEVKHLDEAGMQEYADICGSTLAQVHARSDEDTGVGKGQAETRILECLRPELFRSDVTRFAELAAKRVCRDYKLFLKDHAKGAFNFVGAIDR